MKEWVDFYCGEGKAASVCESWFIMLYRIIVDMFNECICGCFVSFKSSSMCSFVV